MKRLRKKKSNRLKQRPGAMAYFLTIAGLVVVSAYSHFQFREDVEDQAIRAIASEHSMRFSQVNEESSLSVPEGEKLAPKPRQSSKSSLERR